MSRKSGFFCLRRFGGKREGKGISDAYELNMSSIEGDYAIMSSDIDERAIFCSTTNLKNLFRKRDEDDVEIPKV